MGVASSSFKLKGNGDDADGEDATLSAGLCNDRCRASPRATAHAGSDEDHAGVGAQEVGQFVQAFNRGIFAHLGKRACALTSSEGGPQLNFSGHWADVQGLCIGVADDEVDAVDALFKHGVHGIGAATTYTDDFDRRVGRLREIEMHGRLFSDGREVEEGSGDVGLEPGLDVVHEGLSKVSFGLGRLR